MTIEDFLSVFAVGIIATGGTITLFVKFGQSWFMKHLEAKYSSDLAAKNSELMTQLEEKKNELNRELQLEVTQLQSKLEVLGGQEARFLEKKIDAVLLISQLHYRAAKSVAELARVTHMWIEESMHYFKYQLEEEKRPLSDYEVYRKFHQDIWPKYKKDAELIASKYADNLALNMPMLPASFVKSELRVAEKLQDIVSALSMNFSRAMNTTIYIVDPEVNETTEKECMETIEEELAEATECKEYTEKLVDSQFDKAMVSQGVINDLLHPSVAS